MRHFARGFRHARQVPAVMLACLGFAGPASAIGGDTAAPVVAAAGAPGTIRFESCTRPAYPDDASRSHEGTVTMRFLISAEGKIKDARIVVSSGHRALDRAALAAISKCSFNPPVAEGRPVDAWIHVQYVWKAQKAQ